MSRVTSKRFLAALAILRGAGVNLAARNQELEHRSQMTEGCGFVSVVCGRK